jgi:midasin
MYLFCVLVMIWTLLQDITDLFGADLPVEGGRGGEFAWCDGPLLAALKAGHWVVLDEVRISAGMGS